MNNNGNANSLAVHFQWESTKATKKSYAAVGISMQKIYESQSQKIYFWLVGTGIDFVVTNKTYCPSGALIYFYLHTKGLLYTQYGQNMLYFFPPRMGRP